MAKREIEYKKGGFYHAFNRGTNRQPIFQNDGNYIFLLKKVKKYKRICQISLIAYVLMPNHFHFLIRQDGDIPVSRFMQRVFNSYTKAFNKQQNRSGSLFEGPYKAKEVKADDYVIGLCRYIHLNPINAGLEKDLGSWPYTNVLEWLDRRNGDLIDKEFRSAFFQSAEEYEQFLKMDNDAIRQKKLKKYLFDED